MSELVEMEKTFSKIKTLKSRRKLSLPAAASPLMNNAGNSESNERPQVGKAKSVEEISKFAKLFLQWRAIQTALLAVYEVN